MEPTLRLIHTDMPQDQCITPPTQMETLTEKIKPSNLAAHIAAAPDHHTPEQLALIPPSLRPSLDLSPSEKAALKNEQIAAKLRRGHFPVLHIQNHPHTLTGHSGAMHHELAHIINPSESRYIYLLLGICGNGKTQIATNLAAHKRYKNPQYTLANEHHQELLDIQNGHLSKEEIAHKRHNHNILRSADYLTIDELSQVRHSEFTTEKITALINHRYNNKLTTIIIANALQKEIHLHLSPLIIDRINETGGIVECNWPSYR